MHPHTPEEIGGRIPLFMSVGGNHGFAEFVHPLFVLKKCVFCVSYHCFVSFSNSRLLATYLSAPNLPCSVHHPEEASVCLPEATSLVPASGNYRMQFSQKMEHTL